MYEAPESEVTEVKTSQSILVNGSPGEGGGGTPFDGEEG